MVEGEAYRHLTAVQKLAVPSEEQVGVRRTGSCIEVDDAARVGAGEPERADLARKPGAASPRRQHRSQGDRNVHAPIFRNVRSY